MIRECFISVVVDGFIPVGILLEEFFFFFFTAAARIDDDEKDIKGG